MIVAKDIKIKRAVEVDTGIICPRSDLLTVSMLFHQIEAGERAVMDIGTGKGLLVKTYTNRRPLVQVVKPGRNEACFCGSGRKYKYCCLNKS